ncbi:MAG: hypothetical protein ACLR6J_12225 [Parabacteroides merdae]
MACSYWELRPRKAGSLKINCYVTAGNKEKYSIETLRERNVSYDHQHWLTQKDVDMAKQCQVGTHWSGHAPKLHLKLEDRLVYVTEHGDYYGKRLSLLTAGVQKKDIFPYANSRRGLRVGRVTAIFVWSGQRRRIPFRGSGGTGNSWNGRKWGIQGMGALRCLRQRSLGVISG